MAAKRAVSSQPRQVPVRAQEAPRLLTGYVDPNPFRAASPGQPLLANRYEHPRIHLVEVAHVHCIEADALHANAELTHLRPPDVLGRPSDGHDDFAKTQETAGRGGHALKAAIPGRRAPYGEARRHSVIGYITKEGAQRGHKDVTHQRVPLRIIAHDREAEGVLLGALRLRFRWHKISTHSIAQIRSGAHQATRQARHRRPMAALPVRWVAASEDLEER
mmetsp:Transcript_111989/g.250228  ORF Transcript_111989/g.250228 Transcript_111989/m.250228 type:complete len:219 (+) Transcript_111989:266-922(+)